MTVMPAPSSASVSSRRVSGESSTTRATARFFCSMIIAVQRLQGCNISIEIEAVDQLTHLRDEIGMFRMIVADLVELDLDGADVTQLPESNEFLDVLHRWPRTGLGLPVWNGDLVDLIFPVELE